MQTELRTGKRLKPTPPRPSPDCCIKSEDWAMWTFPRGGDEPSEVTYWKDCFEMVSSPLWVLVSFYVLEEFILPSLGKKSQ